MATLRAGIGLTLFYWDSMGQQAPHSYAWEKDKSALGLEGFKAVLLLYSEKHNQRA